MRSDKKASLVQGTAIATVLDAMKLISDAQPVIQALEACGEDCADYRAKFEYYDKKLRLIHDNFYKGQ